MKVLKNLNLLLLPILIISILIIVYCILNKNDKVENFWWGRKKFNWKPRINWRMPKSRLRVRPTYDHDIQTIRNRINLYKNELNKLEYRWKKLLVREDEIKSRLSAADKNGDSALRYHFRKELDIIKVEKYEIRKNINDSQRQISNEENRMRQVQMNKYY